MVDELRNQLKSQDLSNLLASSVANVGGSVFPDEPAAVDIQVFSSIIQAWQKVHVPSYGTPIAGSFVQTTHAGAKTLIEPGTNEVAQVQQINLENAGGAAPIGVILLTGSTVLITTEIQPSETLSIQSPPTVGLLPVYVDKSCPLSVVVASGDPDDLVSTTVYALIAQ
jgi:hypothetical protein|tara:strand:- start:871 stop:1374 length:504 start_codon:yes stop_codon:yes gene_type:complete